MSAENWFAGKKCLVTGACRGIGKAVVTELHAKDAIVYALSNIENNLKSLKEQCPNVNPIYVDLSSWNETRKCLDVLERIDVLVNNAGISIPADFMKITEESFDKQFNINLKAVINVSQVIATKMISSGDGGSIINVSSVGAKKPMMLDPVYSCTKASLEMLTRVMAIQFGPHKIRVNCVCPGAVNTEMMQNTIKNQPDFVAMAQKGRPTKAEWIPMSDVVNSILFLASDQTSQITGSCLAVDGGVLAC